jgi:hypothetical protein
MPPRSAHEAVLDAVEAKIRGLDLGGWQERLARFAVIGEPTRNKHPGLPGLIVSPAGPERSEGGDSAREGYGYPLTVRLLARWPEDDPGLLPDLLAYRKAVRDALQKARLTLAGGFPEAYRLLLQPSPVIEAEAAAYQLLSSPLVFVASVIETRG